MPALKLFCVLLIATTRVQSSATLTLAAAYDTTSPSHRGTQGQDSQPLSAVDNKRRVSLLALVHF